MATVGVAVGVNDLLPPVINLKERENMKEIKDFSVNYSQGVSTRRTPEEMKEWNRQKMINILKAHDDTATFEDLLSFLGFKCQGNITESPKIFVKYSVEKPMDDELDIIYRGWIWCNEAHKLAVIAFDCGNGNAAYGGLFTTENVRKLVE